MVWFTVFSGSEFFLCECGLLFAYHGIVALFSLIPVVFLVSVLLESLYIYILLGTTKKANRHLEKLLFLNIKKQCEQKGNVNTVINIKYCHFISWYEFMIIYAFINPTKTLKADIWHRHILDYFQLSVFLDSCNLDIKIK